MIIVDFKNFENNSAGKINVLLSCYLTHFLWINITITVLSLFSLQLCHFFRRNVTSSYDNHYFLLRIGSADLASHEGSQTCSTRSFHNKTIVIGSGCSCLDLIISYCYNTITKLLDMSRNTVTLFKFCDFRRR